MWLMALYAKLFLSQAVAIAIVVFVLKKILDTQLIDFAIRQFDYWKSNDAKDVNAIKIFSYRNLKPKERDRLLKVASKHFGPDVYPDFDIDKKLLGGIIIRLEQYDIDCSLRSRLRQAFMNRG